MSTKEELMEIAKDIMEEESRSDFEYLTVVEHEDAQDLSEEEQGFIYEIITTAKVTYALTMPEREVAA